MGANRSATSFADPRASVLPLLLTALLAQACTSYADYRFEPPIQDAELRDEEALRARVLIASRGLVLGERGGEEGWEMHFRVRVENPQAVPFQLAPATFELLDARLVSIGTAIVQPEPVVIEPRRDASFEVAFRFPADREPDEFDLSAVTLQLSFGGGTWTFGSTFRRLDPHYHDPYWGSHFGWSVGFVVSD